MLRRIAILTSGGDAPGMNAAIRAATVLGHARGCEVLGIRHGYRGLLDGEIGPLSPRDVEGILREGGTILGSARCPEFQEQAGRDEARRRLADAAVEGLIVIGGNGTLAGAAALTNPAEVGDPGVRVIGRSLAVPSSFGQQRLLPLPELARRLPWRDRSAVQRLDRVRRPKRARQHPPTQWRREGSAKDCPADSQATVTSGQRKTS